MNLQMVASASEFAFSYAWIFPVVYKWHIHMNSL